MYKPQDRCPVIVEEARRYVVWVESMYRFDWVADAPDKYDWGATATTEPRATGMA